MQIGIISDTHNKLPAIRTALEYFNSQKVMMILHCGDWKSLDTMQYFAEYAAELSLPVRGVLGNNDIDVEEFISYANHAPGDFKIEPMEMNLVFYDTYIVIHHGHHKPTLRKLLASTMNDIVVLGHTHKPKIEQLDSKLIINPESTAFAIPRSKSWTASVAMLNLDARTASIHYL